MLSSLQKRWGEALAVFCVLLIVVALAIFNQPTNGNAAGASPSIAAAPSVLVATSTLQATEVAPPGVAGSLTDPELVSREKDLQVGQVVADETGFSAPVSVFVTEHYTFRLRVE